jgi:deoxycytidylate deaminase
LSSKIELALQETYGLALNSPDPSTQNAAILITTTDIWAFGWNDFPQGVDLKHWYGDKEAKYARVVHAEVSAILDAAKNGWRTKGSTLVCPWSACSNCAKHIAAAGVSTLVRHTRSNVGDATGTHWHKDCEIGDEILTAAGVEIVELDPLTPLRAIRRNGSMWLGETADASV